MNINIIFLFLGWLILAFLIFIFSTLITLFPKVLPKTVVRKNTKALSNAKDSQKHPEPELPASFSGKFACFLR